MYVSTFNPRGDLLDVMDLTIDQGRLLLDGTPVMSVHITKQGVLLLRSGPPLVISLADYATVRRNAFFQQYGEATFPSAP